MRIISGKYKGREIKGYNIDGTRPTMDRVKESLFASIQNYVKGSICLDLFAGSGGLGIEALSEGAQSCYFVDNNKIVIDALKKNLTSLKVEEDYFLIKKDYVEALKTFDMKFDIIFLDPPYHLNMMNNAIDLIIKNNLLNDGGIIVCEYEEGTVNCDLQILKEKRYGSKNVTIFKK
jgi:16S rRNA (guanine966-N2)-methyltransferase